MVLRGRCDCVGIAGEHQRRDRDRGCSCDRGGVGLGWSETDDAIEGGAGGSGCCRGEPRRTAAHAVPRYRPPGKDVPAEQGARLGRKDGELRRREEQVQPHLSMVGRETRFRTHKSHYIPRGGQPLPQGPVFCGLHHEAMPECDDRIHPRGRSRVGTGGRGGIKDVERDLAVVPRRIRKGEGGGAYLCKGRQIEQPCDQKEKNAMHVSKLHHAALLHHSFAEQCDFKQESTPHFAHPFALPFALPYSHPCANRPIGRQPPWAHDRTASRPPKTDSGMHSGRTCRLKGFLRQ